MTEGNHIQLDANGAGWGWYVDPNPADSTEFMSDGFPNEFVASPGSAAAGKLDLLTVMIHELGHTLGLEHSSDVHDEMAATVTPGLRRLPDFDADRQLAAVSYATVVTSSTQTFYTLVTPGPRYDIATNPKLDNTGFVGSSAQQANSWSTTGAVSFANGTATLNETATAQTRLNQVFIVGDTDRYLSFTVANLTLDDAANAPDDAFEVALLDANTGLSLLGGTGLTRNDAFLNLQADGTEYKSQAVTSIRNADGSRTYLIDLAGVPAGTAVNLGFDLIGFGKGTAAISSHLTIRDLRIGVPQTRDDSATLAEDTPTVIDVLANDLNARQPGFVPVIVAATTYGRVTFNADDSGQLRFSYTPDPDYHGTDSFSYKLSDGHVDSNLATVSLTVTPVNDAPIAADANVALAEDGSVSIDLIALAGDVDSTDLVPSIVAGPTHGRLTQNADGSFSYTPEANYNGADSFTYRVSDGELDSNIATVSIAITPVNDAPIATDAAFALMEDGSRTIDPVALSNDIDSDTLIAAIVAGPQHGQVTLNVDGSFTYTAAADYNGTDSFTYRVSDGELESNLATVSLTIVAVNDAPVATDASFTLAEDGARAIDLAALSADIDSSPLIPAIVAGPRHGQLVLNADGSFAYTPDADYNGEDSFTYRASDGELDSNVATISLTITPVDDAPVAADASVTLAEDGTATIDMRPLVSDIDSSLLAVGIVSGPQYGQLVPNLDGSFTYTPGADFNGSDSFTYRVSDGLLSSNLATVILTVTAVNDAPVAADTSITLAEDGSSDIDLVALASDTDSVTLSALVVAGPQHGQVALNADGSFTYTPEANYNGSDSFTYRGNDGELDSNISTVSLSITPVNDAPVASDAGVTLAEDGSAVIDLPAFASDIDSASLTASIVAGPQHGQLAANADGSFTYTPDADYNGSDSFTYRVNDGEIDSNVATVSLSIAAVNDAPVARDASVTMAEDGAVNIDLLALASDVDSAGLGALVVTGPQHGVLVLNADGSVTYTPDADYNGADSFTYKISDGGLDSNVATVSLAITAVNDAPVASPIVATLLEDGTITLDLLQSAYDVDGDALSATMTGAANGQLTQNANGTWTYTSAANWNGEETLSYAVSDGALASNAAMIRLTITAVNDAPTAGNDAAALPEDRRITLNLMHNDVDLDGDALSVVIDTQPAHGTLVLNVDKSVTYTPAANWSGEDSFTYRVFDGELYSTAATVRLIVDAVADNPTLAMTQRPGEVSELFRTGWESVGTQSAGNGEPPLLLQSTLEGWNVVTESGSAGPVGFELWHSGDQMKDASNKKTAVQAATGDGSTWLELSDAMGNGHQTFGIEKSVNTVTGATYVLSMDLAGHLGYGADYTRIGIYVDGVKIGSADNTSPVTGLAWTNRSFSFVGNGGNQTIRIVAEPTQRASNGRGMMIDDIALLEVLPANTVHSGGTLLLPAISAVLADTDGSETLQLSIGVLPAGSTLSDGTHTFVTTEEQGTINITGWALDQLHLTLPATVLGSVTLTVTATATETSTGSTASSSGTLTVTVLPPADTGASSQTAASSATIIVTSASSTGSGIVIDWGGTLVNLLTSMPLRTDEWVSELTLPPLPPSLAEQTGLVVRIE